jgi:hypothetical protein
MGFDSFKNWEPSTCDSDQKLLKKGGELNMMKSQAQETSWATSGQAGRLASPA